MTTAFTGGISEAELVAGLMQPKAYPHRPEAVEIRSTHISRVFLAGPWVYKLKRPVRYPFLDYSKPERRLHFCREELRLNRRLAPSVYRSVVPIAVRDGEVQVADDVPAPEGASIVDHAVKMRRLPEAAMLDHRVRTGVAGVPDLERVAVRIAEFHERCLVERDGRSGSPAALARMVAENLEEIPEGTSRIVRASDLDRARDFLQACLEELRPLIERRVAAGRIREGHGDLRAEHVFLGEPIEIVDCERTYTELLARVERELAAGRSVIADATFASLQTRSRALSLAERLQVPVLFVECRAAESEIEGRLAERTRRGEDLSDATVEVYRERARFAALDDVPAPAHLVVDTTRAVEDAVGAVWDRLAGF